MQSEKQRSFEDHELHLALALVISNGGLSPLALCDVVAVGKVERKVDDYGEYVPRKYDFPKFANERLQMEFETALSKVSMVEVSYFNGRRKCRYVNGNAAVENYHRQRRKAVNFKLRDPRHGMFHYWQGTPTNVWWTHKYGGKRHRIVVGQAIEFDETESESEN